MIPKGLRLLFVTDGKGNWFIRRVAYNHQDDTKGEMIYHCDEHLGGPFQTLEAAIAHMATQEKRPAFGRREALPT